jgi:hypothetical protein
VFHGQIASRWGYFAREGGVRTNKSDLRRARYRSTRLTQAGSYPEVRFEGVASEDNFLFADKPAF